VSATQTLLSLDEPGHRWGPTIVVSLALHLFGFGLVVGLPRLLPPMHNGPPIYVVDLISPPAGRPASRPPAPGGAPKPTVPAPKPAPRPEKAIPIPDRDRKPQAKKTPAPKKTPEPHRPEAKPTPIPARPQKPEPQPESTPEFTPLPDDNREPAAAAGTAAGGTAGAGTGVIGGTGTAAGGLGGTGSGSADERTFYFSLLRRRIEMAWQKPIYPPGETERRILTATVRLTLTSSGRVTGMQLVQPSGYDALDRSVQRAVQDAQPFPPFPYQLASGSETVQFAFDLTPD